MEAPSGYGSIIDVIPPVVSHDEAVALAADATPTDSTGGPPDVVFADVRWYLDGRSGRAAFEAGHIPGAIYVDLDTAMAAHDQPVTEGRHPFPTPEAFAAAMSERGIGDNAIVIGYDDSGGGTAGRLVWMLRVLGRPAALLDGGLNAWPTDHETGPGRPRPAASFTPQPWPAERFVDAAGIADAAAAESTLVIDARGGDRFRGENEPVDPRAGHIPGAHNAPWAGNLNPATGTFRSADELRRRFGDLGAQPGGDVVCYCGSGVSACANLLGLERAGWTDARLYVASWSGWSAEPAHRIATGP